MNDKYVQLNVRCILWCFTFILLCLSSSISKASVTCPGTQETENDPYVRFNGNILAHVGNCDLQNLFTYFVFALSHLAVGIQFSTEIKQFFGVRLS